MIIYDDTMTIFVYINQLFVICYYNCLISTDNRLLLCMMIFSLFLLVSWVICLWNNWSTNPSKTTYTICFCYIVVHLATLFLCCSYWCPVQYY